MGLIEIHFIETTTWFPNKKENLTDQKRHSKEYNARLTRSNGGFPRVTCFQLFGSFFQRFSREKLVYSRG